MLHLRAPYRIAPMNVAPRVGAEVIVENRGSSAHAVVSLAIIGGLGAIGYFVGPKILSVTGQTANILGGGLGVSVGSALMVVSS